VRARFANTFVLVLYKGDIDEGVTYSYMFFANYVILLFITQ